jgi:diaminohydroxyphosphoribosylaminopyrimidine deaminase/5-amino-6-(5-phosphoribosylamino)uracil reductase
VGAVIVSGGRIVGEGFTHPNGGPHAEIMALRMAGPEAPGGTLYSTMEPCNHWGRTPPCTEAIITAGVANAVIATLDANPVVDGQGQRKLEAAGIATAIDSRYRDEANELAEAHAKFIRTGMPFVTAKFAASLDGKIATADGDSRWITGEEARAYAHRIRAGIDAIIVGLNTVLHDDPELTARPGGRTQARQPLRVVVDSHARTPIDAKVLRKPGDCAIAVGADADTDRVTALKASGARILSCPSEDDLVHLPTLLRQLAEREYINLLVEGGGTLLGSFFDQHLVDKVFAFTAPTIIGGAAAVPAVGGLGVDTIAQAHRLQRITYRRFGDDMLVKGYLPDK